ncbi:TRAP transporter substrate-binding protein [Methylobacterium sp. J-077]|jgi:tripartite ATP-independent transporter DctP family solute receptor|uniref:TRAP transporter substrate-binding protein n=1 Tax=Methylobacterium sp. J-077 TaxID=2836656 RepID=UPI001FB89D82|nr:TRAP transporter substrate-binding protein [Methylobacterium sp. J-077]MCJ2121891.1 TRAP transporter substrate-binding protein [Methylobacterium sp. J-077]
MILSRRILLKTALASTAVASPFVTRAWAQAPEFTYKFANNAPATHPINVRAQEASQKILAETNGRFELKVFPNNQLGGDQDVLGQLRSGAVEFFVLSPLILSTLIPSASISGVGFAFADYPAVWRAMDGELGAYVRAQIAKSGLIAMDKIWDNGFRQITTSNRPINTPADLGNFKMRVLASAISTSMFKALGASPTTISFAETYSALQTKVTDGQENPLALISTAKLYEVQKYCSLTSHMWDGYWFLGNRRAWERLPADVKDIVAKNINAAGLAERADTEALNSSLQGDLTAKGLVFNKPDQAPFRDQLRKAGFYDEWKRKFGDEAWGLLNKASAGGLD